MTEMTKMMKQKCLRNVHDDMALELEAVIIVIGQVLVQQPTMSRIIHLAKMESVHLHVAQIDIIHVIVDRHHPHLIGTDHLLAVVNGLEVIIAMDQPLAGDADNITSSSTNNNHHHHQEVRLIDDDILKQVAIVNGVVVINNTNQSQ